jgi:hypothetical protein
MQRNPATIISDAARSPANGGEQIVESRRGPHPRSVNLCGF